MDLNTGLVIGEIVLGIIVSLIAIIYKADKKKIEQVEEENKEIKDNYLKRFEDLKEDNMKKHLELIQKINELKIELLEKTKNF